MCDGGMLNYLLRRIRMKEKKCPNEKGAEGERPSACVIRISRSGSGEE